MAGEASRGRDRRQARLEARRSSIRLLLLWQNSRQNRIEAAQPGPPLKADAIVTAKASKQLDNNKA